MAAVVAVHHCDAPAHRREPACSWKPWRSYQDATGTLRGYCGRPGHRTRVIALYPPK